jgi:hypothetical protein
MTVRKLEDKRTELAISMLFDCLVVAGTCVCCYGLWMAWHPLGFIVGGGAGVAAGIFLGYNAKAPRRRG